MALVMPSSAQALQMSAHGASIQSPIRVVIDASNSKDITNLASGRKALDSYAQRVAGRGFGEAASQMRAGQYRVLSVDTRKILPNPKCRRGTETVIFPKETTQVRYVSGPRSAEDGTDPCLITVEWDDAGPDQKAQDDPQSADGAVAALAEPYIEMYHSYCAARKYETTWWQEPCYKRFVLKNDGNSSWNYYSFEAWNVCRSDDPDVPGTHYLISCGRGQEAGADSPPLYSVDYAPQQGSYGNCRPVSVNVELGLSPWTVGGSYTHCDELRVYDYPEAGKMSTYFKGQTDQQRVTRHQVSVRVGQNNGRPTWSNWFNGETCAFAWEDGWCY
ncbi:hypothetical protein Pta02_00840 [Planobispora takensis]|uniref:Uncharacterized protein n=1 Tax=Planobispora takensis TaxID=1367882 RepID=A0A8J3WQH0_9ACTN|nr:hypothetical protein Pta02_00840 [Planobispora takensis]